MFYARSEYLHDVFTPSKYEAIIAKTVSLAKEIAKKSPYDSIAFCGTSGKAMGFILAHQLGLPMVHIRKRGEKSHYRSWMDNKTPYDHFEGNAYVKKYLIVDDFISKGETVSYIYNTIRHCAVDAECVGILLYNSFAEKPSHKILDDFDEEEVDIPVYNFYSKTCQLNLPF